MGIPPKPPPLVEMVRTTSSCKTVGSVMVVLDAPPTAEALPTKVIAMLGGGARDPGGRLGVLGLGVLLYQYLCLILIHGPE